MIEWRRVERSLWLQAITALKTCKVINLLQYACVCVGVGQEVVVGCAGCWEKQKIFFCPFSRRMGLLLLAKCTHKNDTPDATCTFIDFRLSCEPEGRQCGT